MPNVYVYFLGSNSGQKYVDNQMVEKKKTDYTSITDLRWGAGRIHLAPGSIATFVKISEL